MVRIYKTLWTVALALSLAAPAGSAWAQDEDGLFTVGGVRVDVTAQNATKARDEAFAKAEQDAFAKIAAQILSPERLAAFKPPGPDTIGPMIKDFEVSNEKIAPTRYIGTYTFRFYAPSVAGWFGESSAQSGGTIDTSSAPNQSPGSDGATINVGNSHIPADLPPSDSAATAAPRPVSPVLILPFYQWGSRTILWTDANPWRERWAMAEQNNQKIPGPNASPPVILPRGDLEDISGVADTQALTYDPTALAAMKQRYGAAHAIVLIGSLKPPSGMDVYVYNADGPEPSYLTTLSVQARTAQDLLSQATQATQDFLKTALPGSAPALSADAPIRTITARVRFSSPEEWIKTQQALSSVQGLKGTEIASLSSNEALVRITARGDDATLASLMAAQALTLSPPAGGGESAYGICFASYCLKAPNP